jgi:hypothetical protein
MVATLRLPYRLPRLFLVRPRDRLYLHFFNLLAALDGIYFVGYFKMKKPIPIQTELAQIMSGEFDLWLQVPIFECLLSVYKAEPTYPPINVSYVARRDRPSKSAHALSNLSDFAPGEPGTRIAVDLLVGLLLNAAYANFLMYYEEFRPWIHNYAKSDLKLYPKPWDFARFVRNAIGHKGTVNVNNEATQPASWYGLTYGHQSHGMHIARDLSIADLMILMWEMDQALTDLGYAGP